MREDLLGYLLDALEDDERRHVETALRDDPALRTELDALRRQLQVLEAARDEVEPPPGLADQTCDLVQAYRRHRQNTLRAEHVPVARGPKRLSRAARMAGAISRGWSAADSIVAVSIFVIVSMLFFPAIAGSRYRSQLTACQHNLQDLGEALAEYSQVHGGWFPHVPPQGNRAAAGVFGPLLLEEHFLEDADSLYCPGALSRRDLTEYRIPTLAELDRAQGQQLVMLQRAMGGSYGYTLGYMVQGQYRAPRNQGRVFFALLADSPSLYLLGGQSDNHGGRGQNVLFEDLHVQFLSTHTGIDLRDDLFRNRRGFVEAGLDEADSVIAPSFVRPFSEQ